MNGLETPPVETTIDEAALLAAAEAADAGREIDPSLTNPPASQAAETGKQKDPASKGRTDKPAAAEPAKQSEPSAGTVPEPKAGDQPKEGDDADPDAPKPGDSKYVKAQKEAARLDKSWQNVNKLKEEIARKEQELAEREARLKSAPQPTGSQSQAGAENLPIERYTAEDYLAAAEKYKKEGKADLADAALELARQRQTLDAQKQQAESQKHLEAYTSRWNDYVKTVQGDPRFAALADPESPLSRNFQGVLKHPLFAPRPGIDGAQMAQEAVRVAEAFAAAETVPTLTQQIAELKKENERLQSLTSIPSSLPGEARTERKPEDQSFEEQEAELARRLAELDGSTA